MHSLLLSASPSVRFVRISMSMLVIVVVVVVVFLYLSILGSEHLVCLLSYAVLSVSVIIYFSQPMC